MNGRVLRRDHSPPPNAVKYCRSKDSIIGAKRKTLQVTRTLTSKEFAKLQITLSCTKLNFGSMPSFALDACMYSLQLSGDAWGFEYGYTGENSED